MYVLNKKKVVEDLNRVRTRKGITWNKVAIRAGIHPSTLTKFVNEVDKNDSIGMSLETFIALLGWMKKTNISDYVIEED